MGDLIDGLRGMTMISSSSLGALVGDLIDGLRGMTMFSSSSLGALVGDLVDSLRGMTMFSGSSGDELSVEGRDLLDISAHPDLVEPQFLLLGALSFSEEDEFLSLENSSLLALSAAALTAGLTLRDMTSFSEISEELDLALAILGSRFACLVCYY